MDVAAAFQDSESRIHLGREILIDVTEFLDAKLEGLATSALHAYLKEVGEVLVDVLDLFLVGKSVVDAFPQLPFVGCIVEQDGIRLVAISSGTTCLLKVCLQRVGTVDVDDHTNVGLVNAHSEGIGGNHHSYLIILPHFLSLILDYRVETSMIEGGRDAALGEHFRHLLRAFAASSIDDGRTFHTLQDVNHLVLLVCHGPDDIGEILALKTHLEHVLLGKLEFVLDVIHHGWCGCGGEGEHRRARLHLSDVGDSQVGGTEVVTPLTDAVGFIYRDEAHLHVTKLDLENLRREAFRRHIQYLDTTEDAVLKGLYDLAPRLVGIDGIGEDTPFSQVENLVFHQGDERSDDDAHAFLGEGSTFHRP